jgi:hypothetical protein
VPASLVNEFSWSKTRDHIFRLCPRRYWYAYYASWGGWAEDAPEETRQAYLLKKLAWRWVWVGSLVHDAIEVSLRNLARGIAVLPVDRIVEITLNLMRNGWRSSKRGNYRDGRGPALHEHEYGIPVDDGEWRRMAANLETCLRNFYASEHFAALSALPPGAILEVEEYSSFDFEGTRVWAVMDAAWRTGERLVIADWKTGESQPGSQEVQLACYSLYAARRWGLDPSSLDLLEYNLLLDRTHRYRSDQGTVERTSSYIRGSIADMRSLLADPARNVPLPEERFAKVARGEICEGCNYLRICRPPLDGERLHLP